MGNTLVISAASLSSIVLVAAVSGLVIGAVATDVLAHQATHMRRARALSTKKPRMLHVKARTPVYPDDSGHSRTLVPDDKVSWDERLPGYAPEEYTAAVVLAQPVWADSPSCKSIVFNAVTNKVDRESFEGEYELDHTRRPLNPMGRTGMRGRGLLGRWGPNHAADPCVLFMNENKLHGVFIKRKDNGQWAIPGGMVDPGELATATLKREFSEEALDGGDAKTLLGAPAVIAESYVDDPRNTDNAWIESTVALYNPKTKFPLRAGSDAGSAAWLPIDHELLDKLYASHGKFVALCCKRFLEDRGWSSNDTRDFLHELGRDLEGEKLTDEHED